MKKSYQAVVIGASAGGVEALNRILTFIGKPLPLPVVVALHIPPRGSIIVGAFKIAPGIELKEAEDKESLRPGVIYFAPPNYHVLVEADRSLSLSVEEPVHFARPSIDVLFESAAEAFGDESLAILLTGANEDGAEGLKKIHEAGGTTVVQDPATAYAPLMPESALKLFDPVSVASLEKIGALLAELNEEEGAKGA
jgi:two-component system chemotaxis response regulator CheB